ncbi:MAG: FAD-dependent oxidoreductase [Saprospiraceae bacterium]
MSKYQVIIVGAGMAGLSAARHLNKANISCLVLDKGRGVGGRMATRRVGDATFDHGAQFFSAKTPSFQSFVKEARQMGAVNEWWPGIPDTTHPRWIGASGMNAVPKFLHENLTILQGKKVAHIAQAAKGWQVTTDNNETFESAALILTIPAPQAIELLEISETGLTSDDWSPLRQIAYHPCLAVLATLDQPSNLPDPGGMQMDGSIISWMADNFKKGISKTPSITLHASPAFSRHHLDGDLNSAGEILLEAAGTWLQPASIVDWQIHRWRFSLAYERHPSPYWQAGISFPLLFGGDGFGMGNVEGAFLSGLAMAEQLISLNSF